MSRQAVNIHGPTSVITEEVSISSPESTNDSPRFIKPNICDSSASSLSSSQLPWVFPEQDSLLFHLSARNSTELMLSKSAGIAGLVGLNLLPHSLHDYEYLSSDGGS